MKNHGPTKKVLDFSAYLAPEFDLFKRKAFDTDSFVSCGSASLSLITGINVRTVEKHCINPLRGWPTTRVIKYLRKKGYVVIELSKDGVLTRNHHEYLIKRSHVLLINARVEKNENSMFVVHQNNIWHNFAADSLSPLFFLNRPTQDVLLVWHKNMGPQKSVNYSNMA